MRFRSILVAALALAASATAALADTDRDINECYGDDYALRLQACPRLFEDADMNAAARAAAYYNRARAYEAQREWNRAIGDYDAAIKFDAGNADYYFARARAYAAAGDGEHELASYTEAIGQDPSEPEYRSARGLACQARGDLDGAIADYDAAIRLAPDAGSIYFYRGDAYRLRGDLDQAIADFTAAARHDAKGAGSWLALAEAYRAKGDHAHAIAAYEETIRRAPKLPGAYFGRALTRMNQHDLDGAIADFTQAIALDRGNAVLRNMRGFAYAAKGDYLHALADHEAAILIDPTDAYRYTIRAWALFKAGKTAPALVDADRAVLLDPKLASAYATRARIYAAMGKKEAAEADTRKVAELAPAKAVPAAARPAFNDAAFVAANYVETPVSGEFFAAHEQVAVRSAPATLAERLGSRAAGAPLNAVARLKPKPGAACGIDAPKGWYKLRGGDGSAFVRAADVATAAQFTLIEEKALVGKYVEEYQDKNSGSLQNFAGVYDGLKDCKTKLDPMVAHDGLMLAVTFATMNLKQVIWFEGNTLVTVRFANPKKVSRARLTFKRNFNVAEGGTIKLYRATYEKGNSETLGFYQDKLVIDPKIKGNRITYQYATRCDRETDVVDWAKQIYDIKIGSFGSD
jgi:tetratricopeptide (TPR) repeat protein